MTDSVNGGTHVLREAIDNPALTISRLSRDYLGRLVREAWVRWAERQPAPKATWLVPYDQLDEPDKEADRQIGVDLARIGAQTWVADQRFNLAAMLAATPATPAPSIGVERKEALSGKRLLRDDYISLTVTREFAERAKGECSLGCSGEYEGNCGLPYADACCIYRKALRDDALSTPAPAQPIEHAGLSGGYAVAADAAPAQPSEVATVQEIETRPIDWPFNNEATPPYWYVCVGEHVAQFEFEQAARNFAAAINAALANPHPTIGEKGE